MLKKVCDIYEIAIRWIYLEAGHGKGVSDGIGATIKSLIKQTLNYSEANAMYTCCDIMKEIRTRTKIKILRYDQFDISRVRQMIPLNLTAIKQTMLIHDVLAQPDQNYLLIRNASDEQYRVESIPQPSKSVLRLGSRQMESPDESCDTERMFQTTNDYAEDSDADDSQDLRILCFRLNIYF